MNAISNNPINLVLITSIIKPPNIPLSYTSIRSIYSHDERFEQTKRTIQSIKEKIPNNIIILVECSDLDQHQLDYLHEHCHHFINLIDTSTAQCYSPSKSLGEATMTMAAIEYIQQNNISYDSFFKISGRYYLSDKFDYSKFNCPYHIVKYHNENIVYTCLYKLDQSGVLDYYRHLEYIMESLYACIPYELQFCNFIKKCSIVKPLNTLGIQGYIAISNDMVDG